MLWTPGNNSLLAEFDAIRGQDAALLRRKREVSAGALRGGRSSRRPGAPLQCSLLRVLARGAFGREGCVRGAFGREGCVFFGFGDGCLTYNLAKLYNLDYII
jgi:hypothetical protein